MLFLLLTLPTVLAIDVTRRGVNVTGTDSRVTIEMINKSYYQYIMAVPVYKKRVKRYALQFKSLKPWTKKFWFDMRFFHFRNNQFHPFPLNLGVSMEDILAKDYYGIGATIKKNMGQTLPYPPKNYTLKFDDAREGVSTQFDVPMLGAYRIELAIMDGADKTVVVVIVVTVVEDMRPKNCRTCTKR